MWLASLSFFNERVNLDVDGDQLTPLGTQHPATTGKA
jgi:hypothetical protein